MSKQNKKKVGIVRAWCNYALPIRQAVMSAFQCTVSCLCISYVVILHSVMQFSGPLKVAINKDDLIRKEDQEYDGLWNILGILKSQDPAVVKYWATC